MEQFDKVTAIFNQKRTDDLKQEVFKDINKQGVFKAMWVIEKGDYEGQWAMYPDWTNEGMDKWNFTWCPECDLDIIGIID